MSRRPQALTAPSFAGLKPASANASAAASGASKKANTRCELVLRRELRRRGLRYRIHMKRLPGHPDIVFPKYRVAVFCDGDFWHGRELDRRLEKLGRGHNAAYWISKIQRNVDRDRRNSSALSAAGWNVLRFWESDVLRSPQHIADLIIETLQIATKASGVDETEH